MLENITKKDFSDTADDEKCELSYTRYIKLTVGRD